MTQLNLLPWRTQLREQRRARFLAALCMTALAAALLVLALAQLSRNALQQQDTQRRLLSTQQAVMHETQAELDVLQDTLQQILQLQHSVQTLHSSRSIAVEVLSGLVAALPAGVYYDSVRRQGQQLWLSGTATAPRVVSELIRQLEDTACFHSPVLLGIAADYAPVEAIVSVGHESFSATASVAAQKTEVGVPQPSSFSLLMEGC